MHNSKTFYFILALLAGFLTQNAIAADAGGQNSATDAMEQEQQAAQQNESTSQSAPAQAQETDTTAQQADSASEPAASQSAAMEEQSGFSRGSVVRSTFTSAIDQREPVDKLQKVDTEQPKVFYFTELRDMAGQTARHRWEKDGQVVAEVDFNVRGPRWRVWSSKSLEQVEPGDWKVSVLNGAGEVIAEEMITVAENTSISDSAPTSTPASTPASDQPEAIQQKSSETPATPEAPSQMQ